MILCTLSYSIHIYTKVAFTCVMDYTSLTGNFETEDFTMKIAVTYDNGNIFQHFGKTETFKVYEVEDNKVVSSEVIGKDTEHWQDCLQDRM